jgi:hypothetical protein
MMIEPCNFMIACLLPQFFAGPIEKREDRVSRFRPPMNKEPFNQPSEDLVRALAQRKRLVLARAAFAPPNTAATNHIESSRHDDVPSRCRPGAPTPIPAT